MIKVCNQNVEVKKFRNNLVSRKQKYKLGELRKKPLVSAKFFFSSRHMNNFYSQINIYSKQVKNVVATNNKQSMTETKKTNDSKTIVIFVLRVTLSSRKGNVETKKCINKVKKEKETHKTIFFCNFCRILGKIKF